MRADGFSCSLDVLYGGVGISTLQVLVKKRKKIFLASKTLDPYPEPDSHKMLDPDPINPDPQHCLWRYLMGGKILIFIPSVAFLPLPFCFLKKQETLLVYYNAH